jgi:hypothetical protein
VAVQALTDFSIADLKRIHALLQSQIADPADVDLRDRIARMVAERAGRPAWGPMVFMWRLPLSVKGTPKPGKPPPTMHLAPTLNVYGSMEAWQRARLYKALDTRIMAEMGKWPAARLMGHPRPRAVRVTRCSSVRPDEIGVDVLGGKVPIDRLVQAGILMGDHGEALEREARWEVAAPGAGSLLVQVYELAKL